METKELITEFSKTRPDASIIVGYGSEVKRQANDKGLEKQIDLILGVEDATSWHKLNHEINPNDYRSEIGYRLLPIYGNLGTKINYLSHLPFEGHMFKIGVVNTKDLISDLINWKTFFLAGRIQKPIELVKSNCELDYAIKINRMNALKTSLLALNKNEVTEEELFTVLCSLSFVGDWRNIMHVENKDKVKNIVEGSFAELHNIYNEFNNGFYEIDSQNKIVINYEKLLLKLDSLPEPLKSKVLIYILDEKFDIESLSNLRKIILNHFIGINIRTSAVQPLKGLVLNGFGKTMTYLNQKLEKK